MSLQYIYMYNNASENGKAVKNALGLKAIRHENSTFKGKDSTYVLNWGSSDLPREVRKCKVINTERAVMLSIDKLTAFTYLKKDAVSTVPWTVSKAEAQAWLSIPGNKVYARTKVKGYDGAGLTVCKHGDPLPAAPLYTKGVNAVSEYRITRARNRLIGAQRKVRVDNPPNGVYNDDVKTTAGGYGFKYVTRNIPEAVLQQAKYAIEALELDFGGVDIIWDGEKAYVLEVNTAPVLTPRLLESFVTWIKETFNND